MVGDQDAYGRHVLAPGPPRCSPKERDRRVVQGVPAHDLGGAEKIHQRVDQQGQPAHGHAPPADVAAHRKRAKWRAGSAYALVQINTANIKFLVPELFSENLVRGRGLFARSTMRAQAASVIFTSVYAALVAIVNTKMPANGELIVKRLMVRSALEVPPAS